MQIMAHRNLRILIQLVFLSAAFVSTSSGQTRVESPWGRYDATGEEFSVLLPERPNAYSKMRPESSSEQRPPIGANFDRGRIYGAYGQGIVYVIISFDKGRGEKLSDFIKNFQKYYRPKVEMSLVQDRNQDEIQASEYRMQLSGVEGLTHFYLTKKHVYIVQVVGGDERNSNVRRFLTSFNLNGKSVWEDPNVAGATQPALTTVADLPIDIQTTEVFAVKDVTRRAIVIMRPEPHFPGSFVGRIRIRAVLSSTGRVERIEVLEGRQVAEEATQIVAGTKFIPAIKDGKFVSQHIMFEFNFNVT